MELRELCESSEDYIAEMLTKLGLTGYLPKSRRRFKKTNAGKSYYTNFNISCCQKRCLKEY